MVAFNFQPQFVPLILSGQKRQTIRATRRCDPGAAMQLYTGMRTKECRKIADARCVDVRWVRLFTDGITLELIAIVSPDPFAVEDGFDRYETMRDWFAERYGLPFEGWLYRWVAW